MKYFMNVILLGLNHEREAVIFHTGLKPSKLKKRFVTFVVFYYTILFVAFISSFKYLSIAYMILLLIVLIVLLYVITDKLLKYIVIWSFKKVKEVIPEYIIDRRIVLEEAALVSNRDRESDLDFITLVIMNYRRMKI